MSKQLGLVSNEITMSLGRPDELGLVTREITMSLGGGSLDLSNMDLGLVTNEITMSLGADGESIAPAAPLGARQWMTMWGVLSLGSALISGYHGYYRGNRSAGSALGWAALGLLFPVLTPAVALAMRPGFAQPAR
jgi:hypothetical protein